MSDETTRARLLRWADEGFEDQAAMTLAWDKWPGERLFTYVDPLHVTPTMRAGRPTWGHCFYQAGWTFAGLTKERKHILECLAPVSYGPCPRGCNCHGCNGRPSLQRHPADGKHDPMSDQTKRPSRRVMVIGSRNSKAARIAQIVKDTMPDTPTSRPLKNYEMICPKCGQIAVCEMVDIGVGEQQSSPFGCEACGWVQADPSALINDGEGICDV